MSKYSDLTLKELEKKLTQVEKAMKNKNTSVNRWHELMAEKSEIEQEMLKHL